MTTDEDAKQARLDAVTTQEHTLETQPATGTERYRFPTTSDERVISLVTVLVGAAVIVVSIGQVAALASDAGMSLGSLLGQSQTLRLLIFLLCLVWVTGSLAGWLYARWRAGANLEIGPELLRFEQPGLPLLGLFSNGLVVSWDHIDRVRVRRVRRGLMWSSELAVEAGRDTFRVNLDRAAPGPGASPLPPRTLPLHEHPVVRAIIERSGRSLER